VASAHKKLFSRIIVSIPFIIASFSVMADTSTSDSSALSAGRNALYQASGESEQQQKPTEQHHWYSGVVQKVKGFTRVATDENKNEKDIAVAQTKDKVQDKTEGKTDITVAATTTTITTAATTSQKHPTHDFAITSNQRDFSSNHKTTTQTASNSATNTKTGVIGSDLAGKTLAANHKTPIERYSSGHPINRDRELSPDHKINPMPARFKKRITLNFNNIKTRELLQVVSQFLDTNFVISDSVKGSMSVHLKKVPAYHALDVILKSQGLGKRRVGNIFIVAPIKELAMHELQELQAKQQLQQLEPMHNRILTLKYANAEDIATLLNGGNNSLLSTRGQVSVDKRTNSLWLLVIAKS